MEVKITDLVTGKPFKPGRMVERAYWFYVGDLTEDVDVDSFTSQEYKSKKKCLEDGMAMLNKRDRGILELWDNCSYESAVYQTSRMIKRFKRDVYGKSKTTEEKLK